MAECEHVVLYFEDWQQLDWCYARVELGVDIYGPDPGMKTHAAIIAALRAHCSIQVGIVYATEWGREYARREVTHGVPALGTAVARGRG
jgi:hypothetical protein